MLCESGSCNHIRHPQPSCGAMKILGLPPFLFLRSLKWPGPWEHHRACLDRLTQGKWHLLGVWYGSPSLAFPQSSVFHPADCWCWLFSMFGPFSWLLVLTGEVRSLDLWGQTPGAYGGIKTQGTRKAPWQVKDWFLSWSPEILGMWIGRGLAWQKGVDNSSLW